MNIRAGSGDGDPYIARKRKSSSDAMGRRSLFEFETLLERVSELVLKRQQDIFLAIVPWICTTRFVFPAQTLPHITTTPPHILSSKRTPDTQQPTRHHTHETQFWFG
jgi:hypothetical protein